MRVRKLGVLLALITAATGLFSVQPAEAQTTVLVEICIVVGKVIFLDHQAAYIPPSPSPLTPYPGNTPTSYHFVGVNFVCVGVNAGTGICNATSDGTTDPANPMAGESSGGFSGTYTNTCDIGGCAGNVGGPTNNMNPPSPGPQGMGPWSWTSGPMITGWIDCGTGLDATIGAVALVGAPDPQLPEFKVVPGDANGDTIPDVTLLYDCIIVAGVAVMVSVTL